MKKVSACALGLLLWAGQLVGQSTPLVDAAGRADITRVRSLLARGADPNQTDDSVVRGWTPLMSAAKAGAANVAEALLRAHANPNATNELGATALDIAEVNGKSRLVAIIEAAGGRRGVRVVAKTDAKGLAKPNSREQSTPAANVDYERWLILSLIPLAAGIVLLRRTIRGSAAGGLLAKCAYYISASIALVIVGRVIYLTRTWTMEAWSDMHEWVVSCGTVAVLSAAATFRSWRDLSDNWRDFASYPATDQHSAWSTRSMTTTTTYDRGCPTFHRLDTWLLWVLIHPAILIYSLLFAIPYAFVNVFLINFVTVTMSWCSEDTYMQWCIPIFAVPAYLLSVDSVVGTLMRAQAERERGVPEKLKRLTTRVLLSNAKIWSNCCFSGDPHGGGVDCKLFDFGRSCSASGVNARALRMRLSGMSAPSFPIRTRRGGRVNCPHSGSFQDSYLILL